MFSWPTIPAAMNLARERSTIPSCFDVSTGSDIAAGSVANTSRRPPPPKASAGMRSKRPIHSRTQTRKIEMMDVGFIGLGTMGRPMAGHLQAAGHRLFLHDVGPIAPELVAADCSSCQLAYEGLADSACLSICAEG